MPQEMENITIRMARMKGNGVRMKLMKIADTAPRRQRVTRSPRQDATGGAILSC